MEFDQTSHKNTNNKLRFIVYVGMMAAVCFVATYLKTPTKPMVHLGTTACFMASILLGGLGGGLAGGIGMSIFDILNGYGFISAICTFIIKFLSGFVTGKIAYMGGKNGDKLSRNFIACLIGSVVSLFGYCLEEFIMAYLSAAPGSNHLQLGLNAAGYMAIASLLTSIIGIVLAPLIAAQLKQSLKKADLL